MRVITVNVVLYKFSELSDTAKDFAIQQDQDGGQVWRNDGEYMQSLKKLALHFGGRLGD